MKTKRMILVVLLGLLFWTDLASAFYNPTVGKWPSRDPITETGHALVVLDGHRGGISEDLNVYGFVWNNPISRWDLLGKICGIKVGKAKMKVETELVNPPFVMPPGIRPVPVITDGSFGHEWLEVEGGNSFGFGAGGWNTESDPIQKYFQVVEFMNWRDIGTLNAMGSLKEVWGMGHPAFVRVVLR